MQSLLSLMGLTRIIIKISYMMARLIAMRILTDKPGYVYWNIMT